MVGLMASMFVMMCCQKQLRSYPTNYIFLFFLVPRDAYARRPDLQQAGRTVLGKFPGRGQEMCDHYMAPLNPNALNCIREIQHECFKMGIPMKTRHREVAPNQYEMAPYFGNVTSQIDQNLMVIQLCEEIA